MPADRYTNSAPGRAELCYADRLLDERRVRRNEREQRNGHAGQIVWMTGLSGSGKSTIATELERRLFDLGVQVYVLDGDRMREGLGSDLRFSVADRRENMRRAGEVAKLFADAGLIVIVALISPYRCDRDAVREMALPFKFVEIFVNASFEVCERRDPKGLYAAARHGLVREFTGISSGYEPPSNPDLEVRTDTETTQECVARILGYLDLSFIDGRSDLR